MALRGAELGSILIDSAKPRQQLWIQCLDNEEEEWCKRLVKDHNTLLEGLKGCCQRLYKANMSRTNLLEENGTTLKAVWACANGVNECLPNGGPVPMVLVSASPMKKT
jgi:hypothetical protein